MSARKLGRGLDTLIRKRPSEVVETDGSESIGSDSPAEDVPSPSSPTAEGAAAVAEIVQERSSVADTGAMESPDSASISAVRILELDPKSIEANPQQPRKVFLEKDLEQLKASIAQEGLLQPVLVREVEGSFQLIAGERRLRASQELDLEQIPAIVTTMDDDRLLEVALIENLQRADLNPIEVAIAYRQLIDDKGWTQSVLARALGVSRPSVSNTMRLLELPDEIQSSVVQGHITMGHAKVLLSVDDEDDQRALFERIAEERLTVRELELALEEQDAREDADDGTAPPPKSEPTKPPKKRKRIAGLEDELSRAVGTKVSITESSKGKGRLTIEFYSPDDFDRIRTRLLSGK